MGRKCLPPYLQPMERLVSSLLPLVSKTTIDNKNELCRNKKDRRSYPLQLRSPVADDFKKQIPHMSTMPYRNIQEETCSNSEKRRAGARAGRIGADRINMLNDEVLAGKWDAICDICNDYHFMVISLEGGGHIVTKPFRKERITVAKTKPDIQSLFWKEC
jgi:hypothetical protein